ncbi:hypothetical protein [Luteolibacter marinus]|uniref:hypothetical protein n=1 Tax=Luteolibacter marinus TaxID=2776705 RepID=UPI00186613CC|nr:hypothetical protein [Luteolibacter marinus]
MKVSSSIVASAIALACHANAGDGDFDAFGDYTVHSQLKITGTGKVIRVPIKPFKISVETDGVTVRLASEGQADAWSSFTIYRSDGIGRQNSAGGPLEVVPGVQATSNHGGVHKHLRLTRDTLTLTSFPGVSDQTLITHAILTPPANKPASDSRHESTAP